jgi:flavin reductase (DIM6/NTAB) family NADH-FMN oxidoreductase RutF
MVVDPEELRLAMRHWVTGISVVTTQHKGVKHGMTVSSFSSVSLSPPLVVISLEQTTRTHNLISKSRKFGITILSSSQQDISECFSGGICDEENRFANIGSYTLITGVPFIPGGLACFDCRVVSKHTAGTHTLFIGEVLAVQSGEGRSPLIHYNRAYRKLQE